MQHRAPLPSPGRHRRTDGWPGDAQFAVAIAALAASLGVAAFSVSTASATPAHPRAGHPQAAPPRVIDHAGDATAPITPGTRSFARARLKLRPVLLAQWVDPLPQGSVTSCFGQRWGHLHAGVDLAAPAGTPIHAAGAGVVVRAGEAEGYGNAVLIDHGDGYLTHYGHMSVVTATVGERVTAGQQIGNEGSTGHSTGPHLHFEVHQGSYQNPIEPTRWMHEHGVDIPGCVPLTG